jgi:hypothetical protein
LLDKAPADPGGRDIRGIGAGLLLSQVIELRHNVIRQKHFGRARLQCPA